MFIPQSFSIPENLRQALLIANSLVLIAVLIISELAAPQQDDPKKKVRKEVQRIFLPVTFILLTLIIYAAYYQFNVKTP